MHPNLGVVRVDENKSFVIADIPGLIEGAAEGAGLGIRFLKHLARTRVLLHIIDLAPPDPEADPVGDARAIVGELEKYSPELAAKPRWLVFNKLDLVLPEEADAIIERVVKELAWEGPVYRISAFDKQGTDPICYDILKLLESLPKPSELAAKQPERVEFMWDDYHKEQLAQVADESDDDDDDDWDEDDYDVEVIYTR